MADLTQEQMNAQDSVISTLNTYFNGRDACCYADMSGNGDWWFYDREGEYVMAYPVRVDEVIGSILDVEDHSQVVYLG